MRYILILISGILIGCPKPTAGVVNAPDPASTSNANDTPETGPVEHELAAITLGTDPESITNELALRVAIDQRLRNDAFDVDEATRARAWAQVAIADAANTSRMQDLVAQFGWPPISTFGESATYDAWLLVQHADQNPSFQREVLALMEPMLASGEVLGNNYAYLWDRVAGADDRPQRYGTQGTCNQDDPSQGWAPLPIEDHETIDERRAAIGLMPMAAYIAMFDCSGARARAEAAYEGEDWAACATEYLAIASD